MNTLLYFYLVFLSMKSFLCLNNGALHVHTTKKVQKHCMYFSLSLCVCVCVRKTGLCFFAGMMLPTIRSRCLSVPFPQSEADVVCAVMEMVLLAHS